MFNNKTKAVQDTKPFCRLSIPTARLRINFEFSKIHSAWEPPPPCHQHPRAPPSSGRSRGVPSGEVWESDDRAAADIWRCGEVLLGKLGLFTR